MTARGCTREGWEEDERSSLVARVPLVFPVVRHGAVRGDARRRPARGLLARIDVLRHRCALPRVRGGAERAGGHAEPARGHALVHEPEELPGGVQRRRGGGILRPQRRDAPATAGRAGVGSATSAGSGRARRRGRGGRRGGPGRGRGERPTGPAHGGRTHGRGHAPRRTLVPRSRSARGAKKRRPSGLSRSRRRGADARVSPRAPRAFLPPRDFRPCLAFRAAARRAG